MPAVNDTNKNFSQHPLCGFISSLVLYYRLALSVGQTKPELPVDRHHHDVQDLSKYLSIKDDANLPAYIPYAANVYVLPRAELDHSETAALSSAVFSFEKAMERANNIAAGNRVVIFSLQETHCNLALPEKKLRSPYLFGRKYNTQVTTVKITYENNQITKIDYYDARSSWFSISSYTQKNFLKKIAALTGKDIQDLEKLTTVHHLGKQRGRKDKSALWSQQVVEASVQFHLLPEAKTAAEADSDKDTQKRETAFLKRHVALKKSASVEWVQKIGAFYFPNWMAKLKR